MDLDIEKTCISCQKKGLTAKCNSCIVNFKKMELKLKKRQEILEKK